MRFNKFTGVVVAGSIALSSAFAAPASAGSDGDKLAAILLGAAAIGVIVHVANKNTRRHSGVTQGNNYGYYDQRPRACLREKYTRYGWKTYYSRKCLHNHRARQRDYYANYNNNGYGRYNNGYGRNNNGYNQVRHQDKHRGSSSHNGHSGRQQHNQHRNESNYYRNWNDTHR